jgi:integrase
MFDKRNPPATISREDVQHVFEYASQNCCLRDYVMVRLFMMLGLRTSEVCTLRVEHIDFETCHVTILDSKTKLLVQLPLDVETVELLELFLKDRREGYVFRQLQSWRNVKADKPLHKITVWARVRKIAADAGVANFKPRIFRQHFAADWHYKKHGSMKGVQHILRHSDISSTDAYLSKLFFKEDVEKEYRLHVDRVARALQDEALPPVCRDCSLKAVCRYVDEMPMWATGCKYKPIKVQTVKNQ